MHYRKIPTCNQKWFAKEQETLRATFEQATERRRAQLRESLASQSQETGNNDGMQDGYNSETEERDPDRVPEEDLGNTSHVLTVEEVLFDTDPKAPPTTPSATIPQPPTMDETISLLQSLQFTLNPLEEDAAFEENSAAQEFEAALYESQHIEAEDPTYNPLLEEYDDEQGPGPENEDAHTEDDHQPPLPDLDELPDNDEAEEREAEDEEDDPAEIELFPRAGEAKSRFQSRFKHLADDFRQKDGGLFHPFKNAAEFQIVKWLNSLPMARVDEFLQLEYVR